MWMEVAGDDVDGDDACHGTIAMTMMIAMTMTMMSVSPAGQESTPGWLTVMMHLERRQRHRH